MHFLSSPIVEMPKEAVALPQTQFVPIQREVAPVAVQPVAPVTPVFVPIDYLDGFANQYRIRLSAAIYSTTNVLQLAIIEFYDSSEHLKERMYLKDVIALGWEVTQKQYGLDISKDERSYVVRPFPLDDLIGKVPQSNLTQL